MAALADKSGSPSIKCPICSEIFNKPKQLLCSHTYCGGCLSTLYKTRIDIGSICCPICEQISPLLNGDVSGLITDFFVEELIKEKSTKVHYCTACEEDTPASTYCRDCEDFMCDSCLEKHESWKKFADHNKFSVEQVNSGMVLEKKKRRCSRHDDKIGDFLCKGCGKYICVVCRVHEHIGHDIVEEEEHERNRKKRITDLIKRAEEKRSCLAKCTKFIEEMQQQTEAAIQQTIHEIETARDEAIRHIKTTSETLAVDSKQHEQEILGMQVGIKFNTYLQGDCIESASELITNRLKEGLEEDALVVNETLCRTLQKLLKTADVDISKVRNLTRCAAGLQFELSRFGKNPDIGSLQERERWLLGVERELPRNDSMNCLTTTSDGKIAVAGPGGIDIFTVDGKLHRTVLDNVRICNLVFLSDGRQVIRDYDNNVSLFTVECEKLEVRFETLSKDKSGFGGLSSDSDDNVYVGYRKAKKIQVFASAGGKALREITFGSYEPGQLFAMKSQKLLMVVLFVNNHEREVRLIDNSGKMKCNVIKRGVTPLPAICNDNSIVIAWLRDGLVSIDQYTNRLKHVARLITDQRIEQSNRFRYILREFGSGELALCTPDRLYIFHKSMTLDNV